MEIELSKGKKAIIDDEDYVLVSRHKWHAHGEVDRFYAKTNIYYRDRKKELLGMHRLILGAKDDEHVDHINNNGLDNRKCNLRICTNQQNHFNMKPQEDCASQYKGVCWCKRRKRWYARIKLNYKNKWLGYFDNEADAAKAYNHAATEYFGEFKRLNIIEDYT